MHAYAMGYSRENLKMAPLPTMAKTNIIQGMQIQNATSKRDFEPIPDHHNDLVATLKYAWQMVGRGVHDRRSAFHTPVLSTQSRDGPQARVLVLRAADAGTKILTFHTDTRSAKINEFEADNRVTLTFYDSARKTQLRMNGIAKVHINDVLSDQRWKSSRPSSLRCYLGAQPGSNSLQPTSGLPRELEEREPEWAELQGAQSNFAVLAVSVQRLEWLHLHTGGQRRALFTWTGASDGSECCMQWLNP